MSKLFICDNCGQEFSQPLDEVKTTVEDKIIVLDLCAVCRQKLEKSVNDFRQKELDKILAKKDEEDNR